MRTLVVIPELEGGHALVQRHVEGLFGLNDAHVPLSTVLAGDRRSPLQDR